MIYLPQMPTSGWGYPPQSGLVMAVPLPDVDLVPGAGLALLLKYRYRIRASPCQPEGCPQLPAVRQLLNCPLLGAEVLPLGAPETVTAARVACHLRKARQRFGVAAPVPLGAGGSTACRWGYPRPGRVPATCCLVSSNNDCIGKD